MPNKAHPRSQSVVSRLRRHAVPMRKPASARAYVTCRSLQSAKAILDFLGLSYSQFGAEYDRLVGGGAKSRQAVYKLLNAQRLSDDALQALGQLLSNKLSKLCGEDIGISIYQNSPMIVTAYHRCRECRSMFAIDRPDVQRCPKCRR